MFLTDKSFVSYSQLGEDKLVRNILDRLLDAGHVLPSLTYVDIGAYHPRKASNTFFSTEKTGLARSLTRTNKSARCSRKSVLAIWC